MSIAQTDYERAQSHNKAIAWHHGRRYHRILRLFDKLAADNPGKTLRVVEIGSAESKLFALLNDRHNIDYTGIDVNADLVATANARHGHRPNFRTLNQPAQDAVDTMAGADVVVALETLEHIPEHIVVRIVEAVAKAKPGYFVCSVPVEVGPAVWLKNLFSLVTGYQRHKAYTWAETLWAGLYQLDKLPPHGTRHKGFDWRWLAQTIRHNMQVTTFRRIPFNWLPAGLAFSVYFIAQPRD